jgi:hypothetical protein
MIEQLCQSQFVQHGWALFIGLLGFPVFLVVVSGIIKKWGTRIIFLALFLRKPEYSKERVVIVIVTLFMFVIGFLLHISGQNGPCKFIQ